MEKDKMMELDKMVLEWWFNTDDVSLLDIARHFSPESMVNGEFAENFIKLYGDKHKNKGEG